MKRALILLVAILGVLLLFCACGGDGADTSTDTATDTGALSDVNTDTPNEVTINVEYKATEGGIISGQSKQSQTVKNGESAIFKDVYAIATAGYEFTGWSDGKTETKRKDTLSEDAVFTAIFEKSGKVTIIYTSKEGGYIAGNPEQTVNSGEKTDDVMAVPLGGYKFVAWDDGVTDTIRNDIAESDKVITAIFEKVEYVYISYEKTNGGKIEGEQYQTLEKGQETETVTAVPDTGYHFVGWSDGLTEPTRSDIATESIDITAIFSNEVTIEYKATEGGRISGDTIQNLYWSNTSREVTAIADEGYGFVGWDDGLTTPQRTDKVKSDLVFTAVFGKLCQIDFAYEGNEGSLEGELSQIVPAGMNTQEVTAVPNEGYSFICWSNGETNPTITINVSHEITLVPYFSHETTGLPVISIETENGVEITSKTEYLNCAVTVNDTELGEHLIDADAQIRGRGNSTWGFVNKPYKIKFNEKQELFGFGKAKDWVLLANYGDISLVRNYIVYQTARKLSELEASPDSQLVEVYVNGAYQGVYLLCEQVEANKHRVEVDEDLTKVDTGYLIEMDEWKDGVYVTVNDNLSSSREYTIKFPDDDEITEEHLAFIKDYLERAIAAAQGDDYTAVLELIDVKSFAQVYLVSEIYKCPDVDYSSFFMYKDAGGKLVCGPVWDYDMAFGNVAHKGQEPKSYDYLWAKEKNPWFKALLSHEEFVKQVATELRENEWLFSTTMQECFDYAYSKVEAMEKCFNDRKTVTTFFTPSELSNLPTWQEHMDQVNEFYEKSLEYIKSIYLN